MYNVVKFEAFNLYPHGIASFRFEWVANVVCTLMNLFNIDAYSTHTVEKQ